MAGSVIEARSQDEGTGRRSVTGVHESICNYVLWPPSALSSQILNFKL